MLHPNSLFKNYRNRIKELEIIDKESIQNNDFSLYKDPKIEIYYAPHNEYINTKAKIFIVGITPGWSQTQIAFQTAKKGIAVGKTDEEICFDCKMQSRFAGTMRKNIVTMLDELELYKKFGVMSCVDFFDPGRTILHTTSLIKYPCYYKGKNYSGHTPAINSVEILKKYIAEEFITELKCLEGRKLIIPLGSAVEEILRGIFKESYGGDDKVLWGFPHPSGLNARRKPQFIENKESMLEIIREL